MISTDAFGGKVEALIAEKISSSTRTGYSRSAGLRMYEDRPNMIVGRCIWGKTPEEPDTIEIYRVFDAPGFGPLLVEKPAAVATGKVNQKALLRLHYNGASNLDEIRIGPTLHSVMAGTKPLAHNAESGN